MRKVFSVFLVIAVLFSAAAMVSAAGGASWGGPSVVRAGDTITLTFYAGGGIYGGSGSVSYDPNILTLEGYTQLIGGDWVLEWGGNNFLFYDNSLSSPINGSSAIFKATFTVNASAPVGVSITVSATGVTLSDGDQDIGIGTVSYNATIAEPLSGNCDLSSLTLGGVSVYPAFSPSVTYYSAAVPYAVSAVSVEAVAAHSGATVSVYNPQLTANATTTVEITVTAENGAKKTYTIGIFREQDPNYVPSSNADLESLFVDGFSLSPAFQKDVTQYYIWLPYEAEQIALSAATEDSKASYTVGQWEQLPAGERTDIPVTVMAEDGTLKVYTITVFRAPSHDRVEDFLSGSPAETEPTEPVETDPPETTAPRPTETQPDTPAQPPVQRELPAFLLPGGIGFVLGAGIAALIAALCRKKRDSIDPLP